MNKRSSPERTLSDAILLEVGGAPGVRLWRQNAGIARSVNSERRLRLAPAGASDLVGIASIPIGHQLVGVHLAIETKSVRGRQTQDQKNFHWMIERLGGIYVLARTVDDVWQALERRGFIRLRGHHAELARGPSAVLGSESARTGVETNPSEWKVADDAGVDRGPAADS